LQESLPKIAVLKKFSLKWHFLGHIQSNKTRQIAQHFDWVHSLDRIVVAQRLDAQRPEHLPPLNVCIEINISQKASKFGVSLQALIPLAQEITTLKRLRLRGLMVIPEPDHDFETQFLGYQRIQKIQQDLCEQGYMLDTLSMGMSNDFTAAIGAGSTIVRVGTAIFGCRA
jgi:pyridoxal phosphate enzyme (YggS family)